MLISYRRIFFLSCLFIKFHQIKSEICPNVSHIAPHPVPDCDDHPSINSLPIRFLLYYPRITDKNLNKIFTVLKTMKLEMICFELGEFYTLTYMLKEHLYDENIIVKCEFQCDSETTQNINDETMTCDVATGTSETKIEFNFLTAPDYQFVVLYLCKNLTDPPFQLLVLVRVGLQFDEKMHVLLDQTLKALEVDNEKFSFDHFYKNIESLSKTEKWKFELEKEYDFDTMSKTSKWLLFGLLIFVIGICLFGFCFMFCVLN